MHVRGLAAAMLVFLKPDVYQIWVRGWRAKLSANANKLCQQVALVHCTGTSHRHTGLLISGNRKKQTSLMVCSTQQAVIFVR